MEAVPSTRGVIYDRNGTPLVSNTASYSVKVRPSDLPESRRAEVVRQPRCARRHGSRRHQRRDRLQPRLALRPRPRGAGRRAARLPGSSPNPKVQLPGVEVVVETRRNYDAWTAGLPRARLHGPDQRRGARRPRSPGLPAGRPASVAPASKRRTNRSSAASTALQTVQRDAAGRPDPGPSARTRRPVAGSSLRLTVDVKEQTARGEGDALGHEGRRAQARRRDRDEPAERRDPRDGQPAQLRQQRLQRGRQRQRVPEAPQRSREAAREPRDQRPVPARIHLQARRGHGRARGRQDHRVHDRSGRPATCPSADSSSATGTAPGSGSATSTAASATRATRSSTRPRRCSASTATPIGAISTGSAHRPRSICRPRPAASSRATSGSRRRWACRSTRARSTSRASARATSP